MSIIVANWSDKQLDELLDLLKASDYSPLAGFFFENFLASGNRIMSDTSGPGGLGSTLRITVNATNGKMVDLSPGVLQVGGFVSHVSTTQTINILDTVNVAQWPSNYSGLGVAADATQDRWALICIRNTSRRITPDARWFVDDSVEPNLYTQQIANTEREMSYFDIRVIHGLPGQLIQDITVPIGYWCIGEIKILLDPTFSNPVSSGNVYDTVLVSNDPVPHWTNTSRVLRLEFWSTLFGVDHSTSTGYHKSGAWHIGSTVVTATATDINQVVSGANAHPNLKMDNLKLLTNGSSVPASLHFHGSAGGYILILDEKTKGTEGGGFTLNTWTIRDLNTIKWDDTGTVVLSANRFTLLAGTYIVDILVPAIDVKSHKAILWNVTGASTQLVGSTASAGTDDWDESLSIIRGKLPIVTPTTFEIRHICERTQATYGLGRKSSFTDPSLTLAEVYTQVQLTKIA